MHANKWNNRRFRPVRHLYNTRVYPSSFPPDPRFLFICIFLLSRVRDLLLGLLRALRLELGVVVVAGVGARKVVSVPVNPVLVSMFRCLGALKVVGVAIVRERTSTSWPCRSRCLSLVSRELSQSAVHPHHPGSRLMFRVITHRSRCSGQGPGGAEASVMITRQLRALPNCKLSSASSSSSHEPLAPGKRRKTYTSDGSNGGHLECRDCA